MRCIFCKYPSDGSRSVEHIIPESLGNTEHVLPPGIVCDRCNNYFARKIEGPLLNDGFFIQARFRNWVENKEGRVPILSALVVPGIIPVGIRHERDGSTSIGPTRERDSNLWISSLIQGQLCSAYLPVCEPPEGVLMARFLGKAGLEAVAHRLMHVPGGLDEIIDKPELDELRRFVRLGDRPISWPVSSRPIYDEFHLFPYPKGDCQILHEYTFLYTPGSELYFILAIFGHEFALNMGGPELDGYKQWLVKNKNISPLYSQPAP